MQNILLIRLKSIGDVVLTLPALHALRENFPDAKITFLTSAENASLLEGFAEVDHVIRLDRAALRGPHLLRTAGQLFRLIRGLRSGDFSCVLDFQGYGETAWLSRLTGAGQRWGCVDKKSRQWAYHRIRIRSGQFHPTEEYLKLLQAGGVKIGAIKNEFQLPPPALDAARQFLIEHKISTGQPILFLQPFTSSPPKDWPLENFLDVARRFRVRGGAVIFGGGPADRGRLAKAIAEGFVVSAGVPLLVTAGLMQLSALIVGGDTGMLHLAVAQGRRVLMLMQNFYPGSPIPFQHPDWVIVTPREGLIAEISVTEVDAAIAKIIGEPTGNGIC